MHLSRCTERKFESIRNSVSVGPSNTVRTLRLPFKTGENEKKLVIVRILIAVYIVLDLLTHPFSSYR